MSTIEQREKVLVLRKAGFDNLTIAKQLNITPARARKLFRQAIKDVITFDNRIGDEIRAEFFSRYGELIAKHFEIAISDNESNHKSAKIVLECMKSMRTMMGLDMPKKLHIRSEIDNEIKVQIDFLEPTLSNEKKEDISA